MHLVFTIYKYISVHVPLGTSHGFIQPVGHDGTGSELKGYTLKGFTIEGSACDPQLAEVEVSSLFDASKEYRLY